MNSLERVLTAVAHQTPDRVPLGEVGIDHDHVSQILGRHSFWRNRKDTTLAVWQGRRDEVMEGLKRDCVDLVEALDYDIVTVHLVPGISEVPANAPREVKEGVWHAQDGTVYQYASSNDSIVRLTHPPAKEELTEEDIQAAWHRVDTLDESMFELIDYVCERYRGEKAIVFRDLDVYCGLMDPFGGDFNHQMMLTALAPGEIQRLYEPFFAYNQKILQHCAQRGVTIAMQTQDFGMNSGTILSPASLRTLYFPFMARCNREIERLGMIPFFHCCGNIWAILEDYVQAGYKGYQSIQESAGMDTAEVKEQFGKALTLWTGVQCETLVGGTVESTRQEVARALEVLMPGGGFIFGSTNSVQFGAKTENYLAALDVVKKLGVY